MFYIVFCIAYSGVNYLIVSLSGLITWVGEERAGFSAIDFFLYLGSSLPLATVAAFLLAHQCR